MLVLLLVEKTRLLHMLLATMNAFKDLNDVFYAWIVILNVCVTQGALQIVPNCRDIFLSRVGVSSCSTSTHFPGTYPANLFLLYHDHGFIRATCQTTLQCQKRRDLQH